MDPERWQRLQQLFVSAHAAQGDERERLLREQALTDPDLADEARALLVADAQSGIMDSLAPHFASVADLMKDGDVLSETVPDRIGAYRVVRELGRGGAGIVYLADRADGEFQHRVAIKVIGTSDADDPLHQRFMAERQILAALVHPHIARLLDGGIAEDGRPYLVMEYVDGLPITTYCDDHRLDVRARLRLFADVCAAVQHAHQNLVIHRDIKPSNILVSRDGRVHLLDFGIAKLINPALAAAHPVTRAETRMMTPEYASPEQIRGESLTTASDIYSLGVLLYELLCGCRPYQLTTGSPAEVVTAVCEQDPERPSVRATRGDQHQPSAVAAQLRGTSSDRLARLLVGDLDGIVLMAMRKESAHRYASADMFRQDVERYLTGLPVLAHRGSRRYRLGKFVRRHRGQAAAAAIVVAALVTGLSVAIVQERRATRERDRAEQALAESTGVTNFLVELFQVGDPGDLPPSQLSALDLLNRGALRAGDLSNQPMVHARLLDVIGQMSLHLGRLDEARARLEQAVAIRRASTPAPSLDLATSLIHLARVHRTRKEYEVARALVTEALEIRRAALPPNHPDIADALYELGWLDFSGRQESLYRQALATLPDTPATAERRVTWSLALSTNLRRQGRLKEAVTAARDGLAVAERQFGSEHHTTGYAMIHLADHVRDIEQDLTTAEQLYRRGLEATTRRFGDNSIRLLHGLNSLAELLGRRGDAEAETILRRALAISRSSTGPEHLQVADELHRLARELARQGRLTEAEAAVREAIDGFIRTLGARHQDVMTRQTLLADILDRQRRYQEADEMYRAAFDQTEYPSSVIVGEMRRQYGSMLLRRGDRERAETQLVESLAVLERSYAGATHPNVQETKRALMELYRQWGKPELVERYRVPPGRFIPY